MIDGSKAPGLDDPAGPTDPEGHDLALDFLNTLGATEGAEKDRLGTPADLLSWLSARGLGRERLETLRASPAEAALLLGEARRLREALEDVLETFRARRPLTDAAVYPIDRTLGAGSVLLRLTLDGGVPRLLEAPGGTTLLAVLTPVALAAAELLAGADPARVRRCAAPDCSAWFLDTSKGGRRRWCSMATCGNRAKAARHRRKERARAATSG
jgi:predicted RNA-binding Zn ribbon-like protein